MDTSQLVLLGTIIISGVVNYIANKSLTELGDEIYAKSFISPFPKREYYTTEGWRYKQIAFVVLIIGVVISFISSGA